MARVYQSAISCTKDQTGTGIGVRWRAAMTIPTRKVMARKRTRPSHESHSLTLGVDFISDFSPRYRREQRHVHVVPKSCRAAETCQRIAGASPRLSSLEPILLILGRNIKGRLQGLKPLLLRALRRSPSILALPGSQDELKPRPSDPTHL